MFESRRTHNVISHLIKILVTWFKKKKKIEYSWSNSLFSMFFISYLEMMLKLDWNYVEMSQDYLIHKIFQYVKKHLEIILYLTYLKCSDIPNVSKNHVSSN
jgi:hypothetical protein